ncbi:putative calcium-binding protein B0563.7 [Oculina patagonica]
MQAGHSYFFRDAPEIAIHSLFDKYDQERNGRLDESELKDLLEGDLGLNPEQANIYTLLLDQTGDHCVSFEEFFNWLRSGEGFQNINDKSRFAKLCQAVEMFKSFDTDNSDTLDKKQFKNLIAAIGYTDVDSEKLFNELNSHHNGKLSFVEFLKWLNWVQIDM